ncbi:TPA: sensor protein ZraS, partial [Escherichia coli]
MRFMQRSKDSLAKWLSAILPVVIVGLVGLFAVTVIRDYGRETAAARQTLLEKGSVLIRALESGS